MKQHSSAKDHGKTGRHIKLPGKPLWHLMFLLAMLIAIPAAVVWGPSLAHRLTGSTANAIEPSNPVQQVPGWRAGMLRPDGLRIIPAGRSDASHVLNPNQFADKAVRHAYWVATKIPATLNKLYCWCGCEDGI